ncbi:MAG: T9SS type A sorting domain-containing protein [Bacteroidota bacterium]
MQNTILSFLIILSGISSLWAQNYQPFTPDQARFYSLLDATAPYPASLHALAARDSSATNPKLYYGYKVARVTQDVMGQCFHLDGTSWMGDSVAVPSDSLTIFYTEAALPVSVRPLTEIGGTWIMYEQPGDYYIRAQVLGAAIGEVLGAPDSVKDIELKVFAPNGSILNNHILHNTLWGLSKESGFVSMPAMSRFGEDTTIYHLAGIQPFTRRSIYGYWDVGDEHQTAKEPATYFYRVLAKTWSVNQDTVFYEIEKSVQVPSENPPFYSKDTMSVFYDRLDERLDERMPGEVKIVGQADPLGPVDYYDLRVRPEGRMEMAYQYPFAWEDSCYRDRVVGGGLTYTYVWGVSRLENTHGEMGYYLPETLIYYKRYLDIFGQATSITPDLSPLSDFNLAPNPADQSFHLSWEVSLNGESSVRLLDIHGRAFSPPIFDERLGVRRSLTVDSRQLPSGIYFLQLVGPHGLYSHKIMIQH